MGAQRVRRHFNYRHINNEPFLIVLRTKHNVIGGGQIIGDFEKRMCVTSVESNNKFNFSNPIANDKCYGPASFNNNTVPVRKLNQPKHVDKRRVNLLCPNFSVKNICHQICILN